MPKYEYKTVVQTVGFMGKLDRPKFTEALDAHGGDGWDLIGVLMDQNLHKERDGHVLVFKREKGL